MDRQNSPSHWSKVINLGILMNTIAFCAKQQDYFGDYYIGNVFHPLKSQYSSHIFYLSVGVLWNESCHPFWNFVFSSIDN